MGNSKNGIWIKVLVAISFLVMIIVNALANLLPINGMTTGQVSDAYQNLFAPAGITFAIWGLIYLLVFGYTLYQLGFFQKNKAGNADLLKKVGINFIISSFTNAAWIFSWHYKAIPLSMVLMAVILICLINIANELRNATLSPREKFFIRLPFSVYFGWITVATIANATVLLVSLGWNGSGIPEQIWAVIMITVGLIIGTATMIKNQDSAYGLVIIWAYLGIIIKHMSAKGFAGQYPSIIITALVCIAILIIAEVYLYIKRKKRLSQRK